MLGKVLINFDKGAKLHLNSIGISYKESAKELHAIVDDLEYEIIDGIYQDPDVQFCDKLGIDYDYVNSIEAYNFCAI